MTGSFAACWRISVVTALVSLRRRAHDRAPPRVRWAEGRAVQRWYRRDRSCRCPAGIFPFSGRAAGRSVGDRAAKRVGTARGNGGLRGPVDAEERADVLDGDRADALDA